MKSDHQIKQEIAALFKERITDIGLERDFYFQVYEDKQIYTFQLSTKYLGKPMELETMDPKDILKRIASIEILKVILEENRKEISVEILINHKHLRFLNIQAFNKYGKKFIGATIDFIIEQFEFVS